MRILVTGGAGFIGSNFVHHVLHAGGGVDAACCPDEASLSYDGLDDVEVLNVDAMTYAADARNLVGVDEAKAYAFARQDVCAAKPMDRLIGQFQPDVLVHFAAESHVDRSIEAGDAFVRTNVMGTQVLLDAARRHDVARFLHVGTDEVYGSRPTGSFKETDRLDPSSPYSASKAASDLLALAHHRTYGVRVRVTRCANNYGPRQHPEKLVPKTIKNALRGRKVPVYGTGRNVRDWLYVKDHCTALLAVLAKGHDGGVYNVTADEERTNLWLVRRILKEVGASGDLIEMVADRPGHDWRYSIDGAALRRLGWRPAVGLDDGLGFTVAWYRARTRRSPRARARAPSR